MKLMLKLTLELTLRLACGPDAEADARLKLAGQMELQVIPHLALKLEPSSHLKGRPEADALVTFSSHCTNVAQLYLAVFGAWHLRPAFRLFGPLAITGDQLLVSLAVSLGCNIPANMSVRRIRTAGLLSCWISHRTTPQRPPQS